MRNDHPFLKLSFRRGIKEKPVRDVGVLGGGDGVWIYLILVDYFHPKQISTKSELKSYRETVRFCKFILRKIQSDRSIFKHYDTM